MWASIKFFMHSYSSHITYLAVGLLLVVGYFTGIPGVSDNIDPVFHLLHNLYSSMWSNMWAPSIWTLGGFLVADIRNARRHETTKLHHVDTISELAGQIDALSDRLAALISGGNNDDK